MVLQFYKNEDLNTLVQRERNKACPPGAARLVKKFRNYAKGSQPGVLSSEQMRILRSILGNQFADNVCKRILEVTNDRLEFTRWRVEIAEVNEFLNDLYVKNQIATMANDVSWATLRDGNHGVSLRWVEDDQDEIGGRVVLYRERWWDGNEGVWFSYDRSGRELYAVKEWEEIFDGSLKKRRTIYFPHEIRRYVQSGNGWIPFNREDTEETVSPGVVRWTKDENGTDPLGIPIIHFRNGSIDDGPYGVSDLDGGVLAFQDQINSIQHDISGASTMTGFQQTTSTGGPLDKDPITGKNITPKVGPGQHWHSDNPNARFGVLPPGDIAPLEKAYWLKVGAVSRMTSTPVHFFSGDWPSGEALIRSEIDLVNKTMRLTKYVGPDWSSVGHRATEMFNVFSKSNAVLDEEALIQAIFTDPARRDPQTLTTIAVAQADFTSKAERLRMTGRNDEQIKLILKEIDDEADKALERMQEQFNTGTNVGVDLGNEVDDETDDEEDQ